MIIWDGLFASVAADPISPSTSSFSPQGFELALWVSVAMLIRIRNRCTFVYPSISSLLIFFSVIPGDYNTQLTHLLRYPNPRSLGASHPSNVPALLLRQAQLLISSPTPGTGASLVMQNRNELGIPIEIPDPPPPPIHRRRASAVTGTFPQTSSQSKLGHERPRLQDMITSRLIDANETLGIQRGFMNTISELRVRPLTLVGHVVLMDSNMIRKTFLTYRRHLSRLHRGTDRQYHLLTNAGTSQLEATQLPLLMLMRDLHGNQDRALKSNVRIQSYGCY